MTTRTYEMSEETLSHLRTLGKIVRNDNDDAKLIEYARNLLYICLRWQVDGNTVAALTPARIEILRKNGELLGERDTLVPMFPPGKRKMLEELLAKVEHEE